MFDQFAVGVEDEDRGDRDDADIGEHVVDRRAAEVVLESGVDRPQELGDFRLVRFGRTRLAAVVVEVEADTADLVTEFFVEPNESGEFFEARGAGERPEVDHGDFAAGGCRLFDVVPIRDDQRDRFGPGVRRNELFPVESFAGAGGSTSGISSSDARSDSLLPVSPGISPGGSPSPPGSSTPLGAGEAVDASFAEVAGVEGDDPVASREVASPEVASGAEAGSSFAPPPPHPWTNSRQPSKGIVKPTTEIDGRGMNRLITLFILFNSGGRVLNRLTPTTPARRVPVWSPGDGW